MGYSFDVREREDMRSIGRWWKDYRGFLGLNKRFEGREVLI